LTKGLKKNVKFENPKIQFCLFHMPLMHSLPNRRNINGDRKKLRVMRKKRRFRI